MLILARRVGESIRIGDDIQIRVLEVHRGQVRFAIDAPREIPVHREEVYRLVQEENQRAAESPQTLDPAQLWRPSRKENR